MGLYKALMKYHNHVRISEEGKSLITHLKGLGDIDELSYEEKILTSSKIAKFLKRLNSSSKHINDYEKAVYEELREIAGDYLSRLYETTINSK